jgi:hypothetical protein
MMIGLKRGTVTLYEHDVEWEIAAKKYEELKVSLSKQYVDNRADYTKNKESFISDMMCQARQWESLR